MKLYLSIFFLLVIFESVFGQAPATSGADARGFDPVPPGSAGERRRLRETCSNEFRRVDGVCSGGTRGIERLFGSSNRAHFTYFNNVGTTRARGSNLKSARVISNILSKQKGNTVDERRLSDLTTILGQFIDHTLVASPPSKPREHLNIPLPKGETVGKFKGSLPFIRTERVRVRIRDNREGPQNSLSAILDLSNVYGSNVIRHRTLRTMKNGLMRTSSGNMLPLNDASGSLVNAPRPGSNFFLAGDHRANEHPLLTSFHTIFLREHNLIAKDLKKRFPKWNDDLLFNNTRKVNEAQWQKIVFEEWYPAITGRKLRKYRGFNSNVNPTVSATFSTAGFRVGHTMVNNQVSRRGPKNAMMKSLPLAKSFFRPASALRSDGIEPFIRGAVASRAQKVDLRVVDDLRNVLFTGIQGEEENVDLIALNIQRGRDHGLLSYNAIRSRFRKRQGVAKASKFSDITSDKKVQAQLKEAYGEVALVEAWPGLMAEDHEQGSSFGPTLLSIWNTEFLRLRDGDRFFFRRKGLFSKKLRNIPRLKAVFRGDNILRAIILRNSQITPSELPKNLFFVGK